MPIERRYDDMKVGDKATLSKTITDADVMLFAGLSGDFNPVHVDEEFAKESLFERRIAHGILGAGLISAVIGTDLPGVNSIYLGQELKFTAPVFIGDTITASGERRLGPVFIMSLFPRRLAHLPRSADRPRRPPR